MNSQCSSSTLSIKYQFSENSSKYTSTEPLSKLLNKCNKLLHLTRFCDLPLYCREPRWLKNPSAPTSKNWIFKSLKQSGIKVKSSQLIIYNSFKVKLIVALKLTLALISTQKTKVPNSLETKHSKLSTPKIIN